MSNVKGVAHGDELEGNYQPPLSSKDLFLRLSFQQSLLWFDCLGSVSPLNHNQRQELVKTKTELKASKE